jgi:hypothetical protein
MTDDGNIECLNLKNVPSDGTASEKGAPGGLT